MKIASVLFLLALGWLSPMAAAIYPSDHWTYSTDISSEDQFRAVIQESLDADQTLFAPAWNAVAKAFGGNNKKVRFADIDLSRTPIRGEPHNPGSGGWPTIRYFNRETGPDGANYVQKTSKAVCEELGDEEYMISYVEEAGKAALCAVDGTGCDDKSLAYLEKQKALGLEANEAQLARLEGMANKEMKEDLKVWLKKRMRILRQLIAEAKEAEEL